ncbi:unnamed protein product [Rhodiola kirilowii]
MAATASAWATKPGAWALDAEEHEEELQQQRKAMEDSKSNLSSVAAVTADFPTLSAAAATKGKKKKGQTLSLAEFSSYKAPQANQAKGLTPGDLMKLPTGPRERTAEEMDASRIGGGFRSYGMGRSGGGDGDRWGGNRGSDEPRRESREPLGPSRADEIDDWAAGKKSFVGGNGGGFERRERTGGGFFGSDSKADESDSWVSKKSFTPSEPPRRFGSSGFERERRSYEPFTSNVGGVDSDTWGRKREERVVNESENGQGGSVGGRPKLNLQPRTLPVVTERPQSPNVVARPQSPNVVVTPQSPDVVVKPRSFNPFGEARPREEVLAEKLESLKIKETGSGGAEGSDRPGSAKKGFGMRGSLGEEKTERGWWKPESVEDAHPTSADKSTEKIEENGNTDKN